jgi:hypothetical protein
MDREATEMPVFDADATLPDLRPVRRSGGGDRRTGSARGVGFAVAALVLLTAGVVVGGMLENPGPSASPSLPPTSEPVTVCEPVARDVVPPFGLGAIGEDRTFSGRFGYLYQRGQASGDKGWVLPEVGGRGSVESGAVLEVRTASSACVHHVVAEFADASLDDLASAPARLIDQTLEPPTTTATLGPLPDGEWVVRVTVTFETGVSGSAGQVVRLSYFRMRVGPGPFKTPMPSPTPFVEPTPAVTPAVACGRAPIGAGEGELLLSAPGTAPIAGALELDGAPIVPIGPGETLELSVAGDGCATSWSISLLDATTSRQSTHISIENPTDDLAWAAQNRWQINVPPGTYDLVASLHFGPGVDLVRAWRVVAREFTVPEAVLIGGDGTRVAVLPGCGLSISLANGYSAIGDCGSIGYPDGLEVLHVVSWSPVVLEIPGWTITSWNGTCGRVIGGVEGQSFETVNGCYLGNYSVAPSDSPPAPVRFLARPGEQSVLLGITASRDGDTFSVVLYGVVDGE